MSLHLADNALGQEKMKEILEEMESLAPQSGLQKYWVLWFQ